MYPFYINLTFWNILCRRYRNYGQSESVSPTVENYVKQIK